MKSLTMKGLEGGRKLYRFFRGEGMMDDAKVESLRVHGECVTDEEKIRESFKEFWEATGSVGEVSCE